MPSPSAVFGAKIRAGIDIVLEATQFAERIVGTALVITGEGRVDAQALRRKTIGGVLEIARLRGMAVIVLASGIEIEGYERLNRGAVALLSIVNESMNLLEAQSQGVSFLPWILSRQWSCF
ncbi:MAG: glycerate kinase [Armatimonadota bacterium]|nr:glycerate kinase [Armatimonadota bacterium]